MMFVIYDQDGNILSTISGRGPEYGPDILDPAAARRGCFYRGVTSLDPCTNHVDVTAKKVVPRIIRQMP